MTAWIDGSFTYSTSEAWVNAMRSFQNGTFLTDETGKLPIRNAARVPLFNSPAPHVLRMMNPERLFCKYCYKLNVWTLLLNTQTNVKCRRCFFLSCEFSNVSDSLTYPFLCEVLGDPRTNQNPALLTFGILFFRWHNVVAARVQAQHPDWPDEEVFQRARRFVVATLQVLHMCTGWHWSDKVLTVVCLQSCGTARTTDSFSSVETTVVCRQY